MLLTNKNKKLTELEMKLSKFRTSIKSTQHLKQWLEDSNRHWLVFDGLDLVDSLDFPSGISSLIDIICKYTAYRNTKVSGRLETMKHPITGETINALLPKTDTLEIEEIDRCVRYLIGLASQLDSTWNLNNPAM